MKELKIDGVINIPDDMTLQQFCKMFNHKNMGTFNDRWYWNCPRCYKVTHWMPVPQLPQK